jgi:hypothetical protein
MSGGGKGARQHKAAGQSGRKRPTRAPDGEAVPSSTCMADGRVWRVAEFQSSKRRSSREWPRNGKHRRAKRSAEWMIEAATLCSGGRWQQVGPVTPRESASQHGCGLGSKRATVRPLPCLLQRRYFLATPLLRKTGTAGEVPVSNSRQKRSQKNRSVAASAFDRRPGITASPYRRWCVSWPDPSR